MKYEKLINIKLGRQFKESDIILEKLHNIDKLKGEKRDLLNMFMFAFSDANKIDELVEKDTEEIKREINRLKNSHVNNFVTELYYYLWYAKAIITKKG